MIHDDDDEDEDEDDDDDDEDDGDEWMTWQHTTNDRLIDWYWYTDRQQTTDRHWFTDYRLDGLIYYVYCLVLI